MDRAAGPAGGARPGPTSEALRRVAAAAQDWAGGNTAPGLKGFPAWNTHERLQFLRQLPSPLPPHRLAALDDAFALTGSRNAEIASQWLLMSLRSGYGRTDDRLEEFLVEIGRRKFIKPLYEELVKTDAGRSRALAIYRKARPGYHPIGGGHGGPHRGLAGMSASRDPGEQHVESACPLDCPDACSLDITLSDGRVVAVGGMREEPGHATATSAPRCGDTRSTSTGRRASRIRASAKGRKGEGRFRRASWDEALDLVAARMRAVRDTRGGEGILPVLLRRFQRLSLPGHDGRAALLPPRRVAPAADGLRRARRAARRWGSTERWPESPTRTMPTRRLIVVWGMNPSVSGIHLVPYIQEAQKSGARLVVVDPRRTRQAEHADLHLPIHPGTDLPLALSIIRWLFAEGRADRAFLAAHALGADELARRAEPWTFERAARETRVPAGDIEAFARLYAELSPAALRCGWGPERSRNGGSATAAILALPAVAGKFGVRGGGYTLSNSSAWREVDGMAAAKAEEPRHARDQHESRGRRAGREGALVDRPALRLQRQSAHDPARAGAGARRSRAGGPLHGGVRPRDDRYGALRRRGAAGDDVSRADGDLEGLRRLRPAEGACRDPARRARRAPTTRSSPTSAAGSAWRGPATPKPRSEISAAVLGSSRRGAQLRASLDEDADRVPRGRASPPCSSWTPFRTPRTARSTSCPRRSTARRRSGSTATSRSPTSAAIRWP